MNEIRFDHSCWPPFDVVEVIANSDGTGIIVVDKASDDEILFEDLSATDQDRIKARVKDWALHYKTMEQSDPFGSVEYIRGLNDDLDKK